MNYIDRTRDLVLQDLEETAAEELLQEAMEDGEDVWEVHNKTIRTLNDAVWSVGFKEKLVDIQIDSLFEVIDRFLDHRDFEGLNQEIEKINFEILDTNLLVALLSIVRPAREHLPYWRTLVDSVRARLTVLAPERVEDLLKGLIE